MKNFFDKMLCKSGRKPRRNQIRFASIAAGALVVSMLAGSIVTTFAMEWNTTETEARVNVFTQGQVSVELDEPNWPSGPDEYPARIIYPTRSIPKDPLAIHRGEVPQFLFIEVWNPVYAMAIVVPCGTKKYLLGHGNVSAPTDRDVIVPNTPNGTHVTTEMFRYTVNTTDWVNLQSRNRTAYLNQWGEEVDAGEPEAQRFHVRVYGYLAVTNPGHVTNPLFTYVQAVNFLEGGSRSDAFRIPMGTEITMPVFALAVQAEHLTGETAGMSMAERLDNAFGLFLERDTANSSNPNP